MNTRQRIERLEGSTVRLPPSYDGSKVELARRIDRIRERWGGCGSSVPSSQRLERVSGWLREFKSRDG